MGTWSIWHWLVVLLIVLLVFGTKKLRNIGADLGGAVRGFKDGMKDSSADKHSESGSSPQSQLGGRTAQIQEHFRRRRAQLRRHGQYDGRLGSKRGVENRGGARCFDENRGQRRSAVGHATVSTRGCGLAAR